MRKRAVRRGGGEFAIYLTALDLPPNDLLSLSYVEPAAEPLISIDDIEVYYWDSHRIRLTEAARSRLEALEIPVSGKSFLVRVGDETKYFGGLWTPASSIPFPGPVIEVTKPLADDIIRIQLGYPEGIDDSYPDPRDDPDITETLKAAGKWREAFRETY